MVDTPSAILRIIMEAVLAISISVLPPWTGQTSSSMRKVLLVIIVISYTAHAQPTCSVEIPPVDLSCEKEIVCPGDTVRCECSVFETPSLSWTVNSNPLLPRYLTIDDVGTIVQDATIGAVSNLTFFCENALSSVIGDFTSTLESTVSSMSLHVECTDQRNPVNLVVEVADLPEMPTDLEVFFTTDQIVVIWNHLGNGYSSYVYNVSYMSDCRSGSGITNETRFKLNYTDCNEFEITLNVTAIDTVCDQTNDTATRNEFLLTPSTVSCGDPTSPSNGSVGDYDSTAEGTEVNYQCDDGFIPGGEMMTTCLANGTWSPDPAELECTEPPQSDCGPPVLSLNVSVEGYNDTVEGLVVIYSCNPGLIPDLEGEFRSVCREDTDIWDPDPASLMCREPGAPDCGYPDPPVNGSFGGDITSTVEGSEISYQCDDGLTPEGTMTAVCGEDGEWRPNPGDVECRKNDCSNQDESNAFSSGAVISTAVVVTFVVAFTLGNITGALVLYCIICTVRRKSCYTTKQEPQPPVPEYEQVSLEQRNIELRENVAYGPL